MNKTTLRDAILAQLHADLRQQTAAALLSRDEATNEESRAENKYDMHSQEAAYLAEGQAKQALEIAAHINHYTTLSLPAFAADATIAVGAVVELTADRTSSWYFVGPRAGGMEVTCEGHTVLVITPSSPLGRELLGKRVGDTVKLPGRGATAQIAALS